MKNIGQLQKVVTMGMRRVRTNNMCSSSKIVVYISYLQKIFDTISLNFTCIVFINIIQLLVIN